MSPAAERIHQRFMRAYPPSAAEPWPAMSHAAAVREHAARFDVVEGGRLARALAGDAADAVDIQDAPVQAPPAPPVEVASVRRPEPPMPAPAPTPTLREAARVASWSPEPVHRQASAIEQYRRLAAHLVQAGVERGVKVVMVASAVRGEGKSLTAANLAVTLARSYQRDTLLIDADQRAPMLHRIFNVENTGGLSALVQTGAASADTAIRLMPSLTLVTAGQPSMDPMARLASPRMAALIAEAKEMFDFIILDTPPITQVPDAAVLAPLADTTVLVIKAGSTPHASIDQAVKTLGRERILGTVLNSADRSTSAGRYWYGYGRK